MRWPTGIGIWAWFETAIEHVLAIVVFVLMLVTVVDVGGRYFFSAPIKASFEMGQIGMALIIYLALPIVSARNEHIVAGVLHELLPRRLERVRGVMVEIFCVAVAALLAWRLFVLGGDLTVRGGVTWFLRIPHAPLAYLASSLCALSAVIFGVRALYQAIGAQVPVAARESRPQ
jgi:TRAP-type C4-dicarboxylate transport system permease small subunit